MRAFFRLIESLGPNAALREREFEALVPDAAVRAALRARGIVRDGAFATSLPCVAGGDEGCLREVYEDDGAAQIDPECRFLAVCTHAPARCPPSAIRDEAVAQVAVSRAALLTTLRAVYAIEGEGVQSDPAGPIALGSHAHGEGRRDVFFAARLDAGFIAGRERAAGPSLLLMPTVSSELAARHGPGAHVEIEALGDALIVRDGRIVRAPRLRIVQAHEDAAPPATTAGMLGAVRYEQLRFVLVDGHTMSVQHGKRHVRRTFHDFGMVDERSRNPSRHWMLLRAICKGRGTFTWKRFGEKPAVRQLVYETRQMIKQTIGIDDDPFHKAHPRDGWRAKFAASSEHDADDDE